MKGVLAALAVVQLALPAGATHVGAAIAVCGGGAPVRVPMKDDGSPAGGCCKICHSAMRKRSGTASCCGEEDERDAPDPA